jgi:hypothetical protein
LPSIGVVIATSVKSSNTSAPPPPPPGFTGMNYASGTSMVLANDLTNASMIYKFQLQDLNGLNLYNYANTFSPVLDATFSSAGLISNRNRLISNPFGDYAFDTSGANQYLSINSFSNTTTAVSFSFWAKPNNTTGVKPIFEFSAGIHNYLINMGFNGNALYQGVSLNTPSYTVTKTSYVTVNSPTSFRRAYNGYPFVISEYIGQNVLGLDYLAENKRAFCPGDSLPILSALGLKPGTTFVWQKDGVAFTPEQTGAVLNLNTVDSTLISGCINCFNSPLGPETFISFSEISTLTPWGISINFFPIRDIFLFIVSLSNYQILKSASPPTLASFAASPDIMPFGVERTRIPVPLFTFFMSFALL